MSPQVERAERLAALVRERDLDLLLVSDLVNVRWLTGFTGSNGLAILGAPGPASAAGLFLTDFRYVTPGRRAGRRRSGTAGRPTQELLGPALAEHLPPWDGAAPPRVGFDDEHVTVSRLERIREAVGERCGARARGRARRGPARGQGHGRDQPHPRGRAPRRPRR